MFRSSHEAVKGNDNTPHSPTDEFYPRRDVSEEEEDDDIYQSRRACFGWLLLLLSILVILQGTDGPSRARGAVAPLVLFGDMVTDEAFLTYQRSGIPLRVVTNLRVPQILPGPNGVAAGHQKNTVTVIYSTSTCI